MASPVSLESSRNKRPRRSLSREPSSTPAEARRSSGEAWDTPSSAASEDGRSVNGSAKSSRAKRRRSAEKEFPMSFPRLDKGYVPPSCGGQIESGVAASKHANDKNAGYLEEGRGGRDGNGGDSLRSSSLTVRDVVALGVRASVSARQLDELFFGAAKRLSRSADGEGVFALAEPGDIRSSSSPRTASSASDAGVLEDCDLFDDLVPLGMPSKDQSPERLGCKLSSESVGLETRKTEDPFPEKLAAGDSASHSKSEAAATAKERAIEHSSLPQTFEGVRRAEKSSFDESESGKHNTSLASRCARGETRSEDFESRVPVGEDLRGSAAKTPVGKRGLEHGVIVSSGIGSGAGGGDTASSCSVPETPSPQVYALDTPPKSPARNPAGNGTSLSNSDPPGETETMPSSAPADAVVAPTAACLAVPETQPSPVANRGRKSGRTGRLKEFLQLPRDAVPESHPHAWSTSRPKALPNVPCDASPGRQPTTRMTTGKGRAARGKRRNVAVVAAAASAAANDISDSGSSSFGRRSSVRLSARKVSAGVSTVNDRGAPVAEESTSATVDTVSETYAEICKSSVSAPGERRTARGSPNVSPDRSAPPEWGQNGGLPTPAPAQASVRAVASPSLAGGSCHQHAADGGSGAVDGGTCRETSFHEPVESTPGDTLSSPGTTDAARSGTVTGRRGRGFLKGGGDSTLATRPWKQLPQDSSSNAPQFSTSTSVADTRGCDRRKEGEGASEASPDGPGMDAGAGPPEAAWTCGSGWKEDGCGGQETPVRPRRLAEKFEEGFGDVAPVERAADDGAPAHDEDLQQTPASAPGFDYSPIGCSQTADGDKTRKDGLTVAEMLSTKRSLCSDIPAPPAPSLKAADIVSSAATADCSDKTPPGVVPSNEVAPLTEVPTSSDVAPSYEVMNTKDGVPPVKVALLKEAPPSNQAPKRPVAARRVPNPYATGAGSLLTPGRIKADRKSLPASPFAAAAEAAARKRAATEALSAAVRAQSCNDEDEAVRKGCEAQPKSLHVENEVCEAQPSGVTPFADSKVPGNNVPRDEGIGGGRKGEGGVPAPSGPTGGGFQTARGRPLEVSAAAMAKVQHLFDESHAVKPNSVDAAGSSPSTRREADVGVEAPQRPVAEEVRKNPFIGNDPRRREADGTMSASGAFVSGGGTSFQTGRGRALCVSAAALAKVEHLFRDDGEPASPRDKFPVRPPSTPAVARDSGRNPRASGPARSPEVTHLFRARGVYRSFKGPRSFKHPAPLSKADAVQSGGGGSGVARTKMAAPARVHPESVRKGGGVPVVPGSTLAGSAAFQTAKGRVLHVSDEAIARVSHMFTEKKDQAQPPACAVTAASWLSVHGHHKEETAAIAARAKATTNGSEAGVTRESCAGVLGGFSSTTSDPKINASWIRGGVGDGDHSIPDGPTKDCVKGSSSEDFQRPSGLDSGTTDADSRLADLASASPTAEDHGSALPVDIKETSCRLIEKEAGACRAGMAGGGTESFNSDPEMSKNAITSTATMANAPRLRQAGGFSTARGRPLTVSAEALAKVSHLFDGGTKAETGDAAVMGSEGKKIPPGRLRHPMTKNQSLCASSYGKSGFVSARRGSEVDANGSKKNKCDEGIRASLEGRAECVPTIETVGGSHSPTPSNDLIGGEYSAAVGSATGEASAGMTGGKGGSTTGFRNRQERSLCVSADALDNSRRLSSEGNCLEEIPTRRRDSSATVGGGARGGRAVDGTLGQGAVASTTEAMSGGVSSSFQGSGAHQTPSSRPILTRKDTSSATSGGVTPSGFVTGRGAPVHVSADALSKAREFLRVESADEAVDKDARDGKSAADPWYLPPVVKGVTSKSCSFAGVRKRDSGGGGGRSGRGVDCTLAPGAVSSNPGVMSGGASSSFQDRGAHQASRSRDIGTWKNTTLAPSGGVTPSGFVTGRGAPVHVSADALSKAREFLGRGRSADEAVGIDERVGKSAAVPLHLPPVVKGVTGGSCSLAGVLERDSGGGGRRSGGDVDCTLAAGAVASNPGVMSGGASSSCQDRGVYQASRSRDIGTWKNTTLAPSGGVTPSGFVTGRGAPVHVSADALSKAREFLGRGRSADEAVEVDARVGKSAAVPLHVPPAVKGVTGGSCSLAGVRECDSDGGRRSGGDVDCTLAAGAVASNPGVMSGGASSSCQDRGVYQASRSRDIGTWKNTTLAPSGGVTPSGFVTGRGAPVHVSADALSKAREFLGRGRSADEAVEIDARVGKSAAVPSHLPPAVKGVTGGSCSLAGVRERDSGGGGRRSGGDVDCTLAAGAVASTLGVMSGGTSSSCQDRGVYQASRSRNIGTWKNTTLAPSGGVTPSGLVTGRGAPVHVSADALSKARKFLGRGRSADEAVEVDARVGKSAAVPSHLPPVVKGVKSESCSLAGVRERDSGGGSSGGTDGTIGGNTAGTTLGNPSPSSMVFSTGKGRPTEVSAEALARAQKLFEDGDPKASRDTKQPHRSSIMFGVTDSREGTIGQSVGVFSTANGTAIKVSTEALACEKKMCEEPGSVAAANPRSKDGGTSECYRNERGSAGASDSIHTRTNTSVAIFSTGTGRTVEVSADAMAMAEKMFRGAKVDAEAGIGGRVGDGGDGSGSGGASCTIRGSTGLTTGQNPPPPSMMFTSGKGRPIEVSPEALQRAHRMFKGVDPQASPTSKRLSSVLAGGVTDDGDGGKEGKTARMFSTGDDTATEVSAETMTQAKKMFGEPGSKREMGPQNDISGGDSDGGRRQGRSVGSSSITSTGTSAAMFSTGTGRTVVVSAEAMARAQKMFLSVESDAEIAAGAGCEDGKGVCAAPPFSGKDETAEMPLGASWGRKTPTTENQTNSREEPTCMSARCMSYARGGSHAEAAPVATETVAAADTAGSVLITHAEAPIGVPYGAKRAFRSLSTSFRQPRVGKENDEGRDGLRARAVSRTTPTRPMGGIVHAASPFGGGSISGVSRRRRGLAGRVNGTLGGKSAGSPFSPLIRSGRMPPPSSASTPSSRRQLLVRKVAPAGAFAASPIGSSTTPKAFKKSSVGSGVVSGSGGSSGILKCTKRPRAMLSTVRTSPRALPQSDRGDLHEAFPRPAAVELGDGSVTMQTEQTEGQEGCSATRKLFGSPAKAQVNGAKKKWISGRRRLSSLLNSPPRAAELGAASLDTESFPRAVDNATGAAMADEAALAEEAHVADREDAATRKSEATKGETDSTAEKVQGTGTGNTMIENREATAEKTGSIVERGKDARKEAVSQGARVFLSMPEAFARAVSGGPQSAPDSRTRSVVTVLHEVSPTTALRVRFHHEDGRPCCIETRDVSRGSDPPGQGQDGVHGTKEVVAGMLGATSCSRDRCRGMQDSSVALFREELGKRGKDGSLASRAWVGNHLRWIVWKLAATERRFPRHFPGGYLTAHRVSRQLHYRYDVELERAKKSALRAILQGDASGARPLVLCVSRVFTPEELGDRLGTAAALIEVTDGWYPVEASLDEVLAHFLRRGKIVPGTKLAVSNAALDPGVNTPSPDDGRGSGSGGTGVDPLDLLRRRDAGELLPGAAPRLRLTVNSTRRARWDSRLGFFPPRLPTHSLAGRGLGLSALEVPLCTVVAGGGIVTATRVVVLRRYPTLYISEDVEGVHRGPEGRSIGEGGRARRRVLSEVEEEGERELHQTRVQRIMDTEASGIEEEVMTEMEEATPEPFRRLKEADNPSSYLETLSPEEKKDALDWRDRHQQVMEGLRQKALEERLRNLDVPDRKARQLITATVVCTCYHAGPDLSTVTVQGGFPPGSGGGGGGGSGGATWCRRPTGRRHSLPPMIAMLKVWAPSETTAGLLTEGVEIRLHGVNATNCRSRTSGCSLELSAGRQTKIELLSLPATTNSPSSSASAAAPLLPEGETTTQGTRFMPRRCTPLYLLRPSPSLSRCSVGNTNHYGSTGGGVGEALGLGLASPEAVEVDFVGCVFAVTREFPSSEIPEEVLVTASCSSPRTDSVDSVTSGRDRPEAGRDNKSDRASGGVPENDARRCGKVDVAGDSAVEKLVTYRVYFTEPSGACACLEKKILPELSRHHRILRAPSGSCWAILSGEFRYCSSRFHGGETRLDVAGCGLSAGGGETFASSRHASHPRGMEVIRWLSTTAAGGSGGSPPRSLAGAPASHLGQPLLALRRWAKDTEGKNAIRRERQRLHLLLAREKRVRTAVAQKENEGSVYGRDDDADGGRVIDCNPNEVARPAPARARKVLRRTRSVTGFVSSFDPRASALDDGFIGIRVDDGERVRVLLLSRLVLSQCFRGCLDGDGDGCRRDLTVRGDDVSVVIDSQSAASAGVAGGQSPVMLKLSSAGELLARAQALLRLFPDRGLSPGAEKATGVVPSPPENGAPKTADDAHTSERQREASTSRLGGDGTVEPPDKSSRNEFGPLQDVVSGRDVDISSFSPDQLIRGLTGAVFQMMHKWRENLYRCNAVGDGHMAESQISSVSAPLEGAQNKAPREDHRSSMRPASNLPNFGSRCVAGGRTPIEAFFGDAVALFGLRQRTFVIAEAARPPTLIGLSMVAQKCGEVNTIRSAAELLQDLVAADPPG